MASLPALSTAISVYATGQNPFPVGSAFLVSRRGEIGAITAAHAPMRRQSYATPVWSDWPSTLNLVLPTLEATRPNC